MPAGRHPFASALVTGASSGIGAEMVRLLATDGIPVVATARRADRLELLAGELDGVEVLVADLETDAGRSIVAERVADQHRPIELVVNNAGFGTSGWFDELDPDRLAREIDLNVGALTQLSHVALAAMVPRGRGWLLNVASVAGFQPAPRLAVYAATKAYVVSLSESLHEEAKRAGVIVTALCPGLTRTEFQQVSNTEQYQSSMPAFAWTSVQDVARTGLADVARGKAISVPGAVYKSVVAAASVTPRGVLRRISALVQRGV